VSEAGAAVRLVLAPEVAAVIGRDLGGLERAVADELTALAHELGVPEPSSVSADASGNELPVAIVVDGDERPYSLALMRCTWRQTVPPELADVILSSRSPTETAEKVLQRYIASADADPAALTAYIAALARETLRRGPACLMRPRDEAAAMLAELLSLGVSLAGRPGVPELLDDALAAGLDPDDAVEEAFAPMLRHAIEVLVDPSLWPYVAQDGAAAPLAIDGEGVADDVRAGGLVLQQRLQHLGVRRPIVLSPDDAVERGSIRVRVNDRLGPELPVATGGEVVAMVSPHKLDAAGIATRALVDPASGHRLTAVAAEHAAELERIGVAPLSPGAYVAVAVGRELGPLAYRLISIGEVERQLADLEPTHPSLVQTALAEFSCGRLTRVLRGLLAEQVSIRDTWMILNVLLAFETVPLDDPDVRVFDDRLPVTDPGTSSASASVGQLVTFIRLRTPDRVALDSGLVGADLPNRPVVFATDASLERLVRSHANGAAASRVRAAVANALARSGAAADPVLVVSPPARTKLRSILAGQFPSVRVLARNELPPEVAVDAVATVAAP
jgi:hypothetical protein